MVTSTQMRQEPPLDGQSCPAVGWGSALIREPTSQLGLGAERYRLGIRTVTASSPSRTRGAQSAQNSVDVYAPSLRAEMVTGARSQ
jgi:hypothetical protein